MFMRNLIIVVLLLLNIQGIAQQTDSLVKEQGKSIQSLQKTTATLKSDVDTIKEKLTTSKLPVSSNLKECANCEIYFWQWMLVFSPIMIFLLTLLAIRKKIKGFNLREALSETDLPRKTIANPEYTAEKLTALANNPATAAILTALVPPTIEVTASNEYPKSSSRYIAFITSALTWVIALCLSCFFMYQYIKGNKAPELSGLSSVLLALGIGVVPYAFNKVSNAVK
ncbi:MAG: hypothetical protein EAZ16_03015 [Sphingobacteriales bacterium]|nr:MAG: hypothetical protein EAZ16_03015 [Sphingobacteriales bacterium]